MLSIKLLFSRNFLGIDVREGPARFCGSRSKLPRWNEGDFLFSSSNGEKPVWGISRKIVDELHQKADCLVGRKIDYFRTHDLRRTVRTHLARLGVPEVHAEMVIGHSLRGVAGTYNVYDFEAEKRAALTLWSQELMA